MKNGVRIEEKIESFNEPVEVSLDLSDLDLSKHDIKKLTGIRYEKDKKGNIIPVKLGGKYDTNTELFTFYTDQFSLCGVVEAKQLIEIKLTIGKIETTVNEEIKANDVAPIIIHDRTMVPVRFIAENIGANVEWDDETRTVTIELDGERINLSIDKEIEGFDVSAKIIDGRTLVPIRYVSEKLGAYVMWSEKNREIQIIK